MDNYELEWAIGAKAWPKFPRAAGLVIFVSLVSIFGFTIDSATPVTFAAWTWGLLTVARLVMPDIYMRNVWALIGFPVKALGAWPILWSLVALLVILGTVRGINLADFALIFPLYFAAWLFEKVVF